MDGGLVHGDSGKGLLAGVLAGNHHPKRLGTQILSSLVFLDTTSSAWSSSSSRLLPLNWNTYPTAMADAVPLDCKLLTRWAFEYFDEDILNLVEIGE